MAHNKAGSEILQEIINLFTCSFVSAVTKPSHLLFPIIKKILQQSLSSSFSNSAIHSIVTGLTDNDVILMKQIVVLLVEYYAVLQN